MKKTHILYCMAVLSFLLGIQDGKVALWKTGHSQPLYVSRVSAASLPETDQTRLAQGILVEDEAALRQLLEDYLS